MADFFSKLTDMANADLNKNWITEEYEVKGKDPRFIRILKSIFSPTSYKDINATILLGKIKEDINNNVASQTAEKIGLAVSFLGELKGKLKGTRQETIKSLITMLTMQLAACDKKHEDVNDQLESTNSQVEKANATIATLKAKNIQLAGDADDSALLIAEQADLLAQICSLSSQLSELKRQINSLREDVAKIEKIKEISSQLEEALRVATLKLASTEGENAALQQENARSHSELEAQSKQLDKNVAELSKLQGQIEDLENKLQVKDGQLNEKEGIEEKLAESKDAIARLRSSIEGQKTGHQEEIGKLTAQISHLTAEKAKIAQGVQENAALKKEIQNLQGQFSQLAHDCTALFKEKRADSPLSETDLSMAETVDGRESPTQEVAENILSIVQQLVEERDDLNHKLESSEEKVSASMANLEEQKSKQVQLEEQLHVFKQQGQGQEASLRDLEAALTQSQKEVESAKKEADASKLEYETAKEKLQQDFTDKGAALQRQLTELQATFETRLTELSSQLEGAKEDLSTSQGKVEEQEQLQALLRAQIDQLTRREQGKEEELNTLQAALKQSEHKLQSAKEEVGRVKAEYDAVLALVERQEGQIKELAVGIQDAIDALKINEIRVVSESALSGNGELLKEQVDTFLAAIREIPVEDKAARRRDAELAKAAKKRLQAAEGIKNLVEKLPDAVRAASITALSNEEIVNNLSQFAAALEQIAKYNQPEDRREVIENLALVVANGMADLPLEQKAPIRQILDSVCNACTWLKDEQSIKSWQILATLSEENGDIEILDRRKIEKAAEEAIGQVDKILTHNELNDGQRANFKDGMQNVILDYLEKLGFSSSPDGVDALVKYVRSHGKFPKAIASYLSCGPRNLFQAQEQLAKMLYQYTACDSKTHNRFNTVASLTNLSWLTEAGKSSDAKAEILLKYIQSTPPQTARTNEQALWGQQVHKIMNGRKPDPIYAPGGAGKTVTVQQFMRLIEAIFPKNRSVFFVSPFAQKPTGTDGILTKLLPPPNDKNEILIEVGDLTTDAMQKAAVAIDECHMIRPEQKIFLVNDKNEKVEVPAYLQLTATPLTTGYNLTEATATALDAVKAAKDEIEKVLAAKDEKASEIMDKAELVATLKAFMDDTNQKILAHSGLNDNVREKGKALRELLEKPSSTYEDLKKAAKNFIGGRLLAEKGATGTGLLGNSTSWGVIKDDRNFVRFVERIALKIDPIKAKKYADLTTYWEREEKLVKLEKDDTKADRIINQAVEKARLKDQRMVQQVNLQSARDTLTQEEKRLETALVHHQELANSFTIYHETKERRENAMAAMHYEPSTLANWSEDQSACITKLKDALDKAKSRRVQFILPGLRFNKDMLHALVEGLKEGSTGRVFIYHDSEKGSTTYGEDRCIKVEADGRTRELSLATYRHEITKEEPLTIEQVRDNKEQVVMLYDDTNKQGGDYGLFSRADLTVKAPIDQFIFLDIQASSEKKNPSEALSSADMYQAQCRRRGKPGVDDQPSPVIYGAVRDLYSEATPEGKRTMLNALPISVLQKMVTEASGDQLTRALAGTTLSTKEALVNMLAQRSLRDTSKISLLYSMEKKQAEIEAILLQSEAIEHIKDKVLAVVAKHTREQSPHTSLHTSLDKLKGLVSEIRKDQPLESNIRRIADKVETIKKHFLEQHKKLTPEAKLISSPAKASLPLRLQRGAPVQPIPTVAQRTEEENQLYALVLESLSTIGLVEAYLQQSSPQKI